MEEPDAPLLHSELMRISEAVSAYIDENRNRLRWLPKLFVVASVESTLLVKVAGTHPRYLFECRLVSMDYTLRSIFLVEIADCVEVHELWDLRNSELLMLAFSNFTYAPSTTNDTHLPHFSVETNSEVSFFELEQTNSAFVVEKEFFVKFYRKVGSGSREQHIYNLLRTCDAIPSYIGCFFDEAGDPVALVIERMSDTRTAMDVAIEISNRRDSSNRSSITREISFVLKSSARLLGKVHDALAATSLGQVNLITRDDVTNWLNYRLRARGDLTRPANVGSSEIVIKAVNTMWELLDFLSMELQPFDIHGDFHLGQVVWNNGSPRVIDFEGEPIEAPNALEMNLFQRDLAGLLRSAHYLWCGYQRSSKSDDYDDTGTLEEYRRAIIDGYISSPTRHAMFENVDSVARICIFELEKALYELNYEEKFRPTTVRVPLEFLAKSSRVKGAFDLFCAELDDGSTRDFPGRSERLQTFVVQGYGSL